LGLSNRLPAIAHFIGQQTGATNVEITQAEQMGGGAIQQNWALDVTLAGGGMAGAHRVVLRADAPSGVFESRTKAEEFALLRIAHGLGMAVAEPLWLEPSGKVMGAPFHVTRRLSGSADPRKLVRGIDAEAGDALARALGQELAKLHRVTPAQAPKGLEFLALPKGDLVTERLEQYRSRLDRLSEPRPVLEWAIGRLGLLSPGTDRLVLCHRDYRTGNYLVEDGKLRGILDFEFAGWSDPHEDLGWFCARCWRFGAGDREAGGIGSRQAFYDGYAGGGGRIHESRVKFWEIMAALRWALIALEQAERHLSGAEESIELLLTGLTAIELEYDLLMDIARGKPEGSRDGSI
jgi:aminoglycoside phosphotransferase (APT) family kinase protein